MLQASDLALLVGYVAEQDFISDLEMRRLHPSCGSSASREDKISYTMILLYLLAVFNKVVSTSNLSLTVDIKFSAILPKARQVPLPLKKISGLFP